MKAYAYLGGRKLELVEKERPHPGRKTLVVRIILSAICGTDLRTHRYGSDRIAPPRIIGHEGCGIVVEVGADVKGYREGERVVTVPAVGCGICRWCRQGVTNMCESLTTVGFDYDGTFAPYMEVPEQAIRMGNLLHVDESISDEEAVIAEPVACCLNGQEFLHIGPQDTVFIFGSGFIGCIHAQLALMHGAHRVFLSDISNIRLEIARTLLPRVETINTTERDPLDFIREVTGGKGADVIITACPSGEAHTTALKIAAPRARISLFGGIAEREAGFLNSNTIHYRELSLFGSHASTVEQNLRILSRLSDGTLDIKKFISGTFPLERIEDAFASLKSEKMLKVLVKP